MIHGLEKLNDKETELMLKAPVIVGILIAGADGNIDKKEIKEAISVISQRKRSDYALSSYLREVSEDFEDKLMILVQSYPHKPDQRAFVIAKELSGLNALWPKIDKEVAIRFYSMLLELAESIASSSGGILGYKKVGSEEEVLIRLSMITDPSI